MRILQSGKHTNTLSLIDSDRLYNMACVCDACTFSAWTLLAGWQEGHPACKILSGGVLAWLSILGKVQICI